MDELRMIGVVGEGVSKRLRHSLVGWVRQCCGMLSLSHATATTCTAGALAWRP
jgi:hypothetical protein